MCRRGPLAFADDGQSGAVNDEVQAGARAGAPKREGEMLTASRERGVIGGREIDAQHPEDRGQEALGLTQRSVEDETERQGGFDGEIGILELPAPPADASRCPRGDRVGREPEGDVASPHEGSVVLGPVPDAIRCLVRRMHSRLHIEIMTRRRSRWSTCRPLLAHRAESAHQRRAGLAPAVRRAGHRVVEVNRGDRRTRRAAGKSDTLDAEVAARSVLAGQSTAIPKTADGAVEMMRQLKITRDTAVKARTTAMNTLKQIVVHAPPALREALHDLTDHGLLTRCAGLRPGPIDTPTASAKYTLRALARRWMALTEEMAIHDQHLARLTTETSPTLREGFGVGAHTAAELLIVFGDNPDRIRSEAAFAKLCGACPLPASSGMTTGRHRLNRGGHRHANAALYRAVIVRKRYHQPTVDDVARRTADGRTKREIIRGLKRFLAREIYQRVMTDFRARQELIQAA